MRKFLQWLLYKLINKVYNDVSLHFETLEEIYLDVPGSIKGNYCKVITIIEPIEWDPELKQWLKETDVNE